MENNNPILEVVSIAGEIMPIKPGKCACALAARQATHTIDSFMDVVSRSPGFLVYQPHRDEELGEIDHYIKQTDELCQLGGILSELFNTKEKVQQLIEKKALFNDDIQKVVADESISMEEINEVPAIQQLGQDIWNFMLNDISGRFKDILAECQEAKKLKEAGL